MIAAKVALADATAVLTAPTLAAAAAAILHHLLIHIAAEAVHDEFAQLLFHLQNLLLVKRNLEGFGFYRSAG